MCQIQDPVSHVRIVRCVHGNNYLSLGNLTLNMSDAELALLDQAIRKLAARQPLLQKALQESVRETSIHHTD